MDGVQRRRRHLCILDRSLLKCGIFIKQKFGTLFLSFFLSFFFWFPSLAWLDIVAYIGAKS